VRCHLASVDTGLEYHELAADLKQSNPLEARGGPIGLGYRVPLVIASPWSRGGCVCSQVFDHTSVLQFLETFLTHKTGKPVREPNVNEWRRTVCGDLTSAFQPAGDDRGVMPSFPPRDEFIESIHKAKFAGPPANFHPLTAEELEQIRRDPWLSLLPRQEPGTRPSCPLPYELAVDGTLDAATARFKLTFAAKTDRFGSRSAGAPFIVYAVTKPGDVQVRNYAVAAGDRLIDSWDLADFADGRYDLRVYGPNGFFRHFKGGADDAPVDVEVAPSREGQTVEVRVTNRNSHISYALEVSDQGYGSATVRRSVPNNGATTIEIDARQSRGWYDFRVETGFPRSERRYAGRVETGEWSVSDPAMGKWQRKAKSLRPAQRQPAVDDLAVERRLRLRPGRLQAPAGRRQVAGPAA
jgi:phospholipase C